MSRPKARAAATAALGAHVDDQRAVRNLRGHMNALRTHGRDSTETFHMRPGTVVAYGACMKTSKCFALAAITVASVAVVSCSRADPSDTNVTPRDPPVATAAVTDQPGPMAHGSGPEHERMHEQMMDGGMMHDGAMMQPMGGSMMGHR